MRYLFRFLFTVEMLSLCVRYVWYFEDSFYSSLDDECVRETTMVYSIILTEYEKKENPTE